MQVKVSDFQWNRKGYAELMRTPGVQSVVSGYADTVLHVANSGLKTDGDKRDGYVKRQFHGKLTDGYVVRTANKHAMNKELKSNNLLKGLGAIGG